MKILLTGSDGFLGTHFREMYGDVFAFENWDLKRGMDVADIKSIKAKVVVHAASHISVEESYLKPEEYFINNTLYTLRLVRAAIQSGVKRFIYISSCAAGSTIKSPYGLSKYFSEQILDMYKDDIEIVSLRPFNIYGKGQSKEYAGVISKFVDAIKNNEPLTIYGDGESRRDFVHVSDVCKVIKTVIEADGKDLFYSPYEVGTGFALDIATLANVMLDVAGKDLEVKYEDPRVEEKESYATYRNNDFLPIYKNIREGLEELIHDGKN